ncbi:hypothetical protein AKJ37_03385 [candidate division MSBL1 archaeon SCGC-AAA259I09]|uniref:Uncharacterized protein n=4 Tax=candidate division MSBL1 TaxID=215777 RepID=A0A133UPH1_9EURY|nr:hypothetical protein AKJ66_03925 [candidate division MSBL1 archaeon SCGC-AAA259E22]KXA96017.1 hypothetical protein AKJ38_04080 [candidate division MSBL1 archaeon SCGC-AAA259I14]KXA97238.1 hypothetical protein AKJ37_03385 [candidate division MSBL1 archaeon SCGC-AAA259I09]KXA99777.1 hypothetical protein AKJ40_02420 [candidate division MSBL1 archaeon SCGC-AAA259M10]
MLESWLFLAVNAVAPTDIAEKIARKIEKEIEGRSTIKEIRSRVLEKLGDIEEDWVERWKEYEKKKKSEQLEKLMFPTSLQLFIT